MSNALQKITCGSKILFCGSGISYPQINNKSEALHLNDAAFIINCWKSNLATVRWTQHSILLKFWTFKMDAEVYFMEADIRF